MDSFRIAGPLLRLLPPETAHGITLWALRQGLAPVRWQADDPILATRIWGRTLPNPLGLAAGFDKNAAVPGPMLGLGFGFTEVGSVTPRPQPGNPKPRIFRLAEDAAVINRLGFNNQGAAVVAERLRHWIAEGRTEGRAAGRTGLVGVNLGKNRDSTDAAADYAAGTKALAAVADYLVINVSSPNTPGLRALQSRAALEDLIARVRAALAAAVSENPPPLVLKIAPDLTGADKEDIAAVALAREADWRLDGLIVTNTTIQRPAGLAGRYRAESGGLSGRPLFELSTQVLADMYRLTGGQVPLIGVGGVAGGADAYAKIRAGATLVQLYTALIYQGPSLVSRIKTELAEALRRDGFSSVAEAVGTGCL